MDQGGVSLHQDPPKNCRKPWRNFLETQNRCAGQGFLALGLQVPTAQKTAAPPAPDDSCLGGRFEGSGLMRKQLVYSIDYDLYLLRVKTL